MTFWTLGRVSVMLQVVLIGLVLAVLSVSMTTLIKQNRGFALEAEERSRQTQAATVRNRQAIEAMTCILLLPPDERTAEHVEGCLP